MKNKFKPKKKKCRNTSCGQEFMTQRPMQSACGISCANALGRKSGEKKAAEKAKKERAEHRQAKERIKTKAEHTKDTEVAFNAWVRERDYDQPCISCGTTADVQYAAGHYRTVGGNRELRFEPLNVHKQCNRNCNMAKSGNIVEYRIRLTKKIGADKVAWLEGPHEPKHYTIEDLKALTKEYRAKLRELKKSHNEDCQSGR